MVRTELEIKNLVEHILRNSGAVTIPIDLFRVCDSEGIEIYESDFQQEKISGIIRKHEGRYAIFVNKNDSPYRVRFTIAHELGHYFLHMKDNWEVESYVDMDGVEFARSQSEQLSTLEMQQEKEANQFAAHILMPEQSMRDIWNSIADADKIADIFQVAVSTLSVRLQSLHLLAL